MAGPASRFRGAQVQRALPGRIALFALGVGLVLASLPESRGYTQGIVGRVLTPAQEVTASALGAAVGLVGTIRQAGDLASQNRSYRDEIERLQALTTLIRELEAENEDLRALLGLREGPPAGSLLPAQVIARDPLNLVQAIVVDRGRQDGVAVNLPVITYRGVVGRIVEVGPTSSKALLVTDVNSAVPVRTQDPASRATGVVRGMGSGRLLLQYVSREDPLQSGALLVTSGVGGTFPPGLLVGTVAQVRQADIALFQEALVASAVSLRDLERVYILTKPLESPPS